MDSGDIEVRAMTAKVQLKQHLRVIFLFFFFLVPLIFRKVYDRARTMLAD